MFDIEQLRSLIAVAGTLSFTRAAEQLGIRQSTVSQHIRKLEQSAGRPLFLRDTRSVTLTSDGEAMAGFARSILEKQQEAVRYFSGPVLSGRLRFGVSDDLALTALPRILREFRRLYPLIELELAVGQSTGIHRQVDAGRLDVAFVKHQPGDPGGAVVRRDNLIWAGARGTRIDEDQPVPLVVYQAPSLSRALSVQALETADRPYRIACTVRGVNGVLAAVRAGLGIAVFARSLAPSDLAELPPSSGLPSLGDIDFVLLTGPRAPGEAAKALSDAILSSIRPEVLADPGQRASR